jgi:hypothetical protein
MLFSEMTLATFQKGFNVFETCVDKFSCQEVSDIKASSLFEEILKMGIELKEYKELESSVNTLFSTNQIVNRLLKGQY